MHGHTGGGLTMGRGFPNVSSPKRKLNTRSWTESKLVGVVDILSSILWTRYFLKAQGYSVRDNVIFQDNKIQSYWRETERYPAAGAPNTKMSDIFLSLIGSPRGRYEWIGVQQMIW